MKATDDTTPMISVPANVLKEFMNTEDPRNGKMTSEAKTSISIKPAVSSVLSNLSSSISIGSKRDERDEDSGKSDDNEESTQSLIARLLPNSSISTSVSNTSSSLSSHDSALATLTSLGSSVSAVTNGASTKKFLPSISFTKKKLEEDNTDSSNTSTPNTSPPPKKRKSVESAFNNYGLLSSISLKPASKNYSSDSGSNHSSRDSSENRENDNLPNGNSSISISASQRSTSRSPSPPSDKETKKTDSNNDTSEKDSFSDAMAKLKGINASISYSTKNVEPPKESDSDSDSSDDKREENSISTKRSLTPDDNSNSKATDHKKIRLFRHQIPKLPVRDDSKSDEPEKTSSNTNLEKPSDKKEEKSISENEYNLNKLLPFGASISVTPSKSNDRERDNQSPDNSTNNKSDSETEAESNTSKLISSYLSNSSITLSNSISRVSSSVQIKSSEEKENSDSAPVMPKNIVNTPTKEEETDSSSNTKELRHYRSNENISQENNNSSISITKNSHNKFPSINSTSTFNSISGPTPLQPVAEYVESSTRLNGSKSLLKTSLTELAPLVSSTEKVLKSMSDSNKLDDGCHKLPSSFESRKSEIYHLEKRLKSLRGYDTKENNRLNEEEIKKVQKETKRKLKIFGRKELESLILEQFTEKILHQHELGKQKQLCEKLEAALENFRKKTAQFHKEFDDMKKVTQKIQTEHSQRKNHLPAPIRIKRSVGIQAAPNIINKGIMNASNNKSPPKNIAIAPNMKVAPQVRTDPLVTQSNNPPPPYSTAITQNSTAQKYIPVNPQQGIVPTGTLRPVGGQMLLVTTGQNSAALPVVMSRQGQDVSGQQHPTINQQIRRLIPNQSGIIDAAPGTVFSQRPVLLAQSAPQPPAQRNTGIIDLTDDDDNSRRSHAQTHRINTKPMTSLPQNTSLLVIPPSTSDNSPFFVKMASSTQTSNVKSPLLGQALKNSNSSTPTSSRETTPVQNRHPAPLPRTPIQQMGGSTKMLPPQPTLKLSHKENSIVLSWTMNKTINHEAIASYQLYAYQEGSTAPSSALWKKVGSVKALELPMACTLTQFMPGHTYHFAVRAVDAKNRLGPFSDPKSIRLSK